MAIGHSEPHYQLLNGKRKYGQPIVHSMVLIGLAVLVIFLVVFLICIIGRNIEGTNHKNEPIDFVLLGPQYKNFTSSISRKT